MNSFKTEINKKIQPINSAEAAEYLKVSKRTLQRLRDNGKIRYYQDSRIIRYKIEDLEEYLEGNVMEPFIMKGGKFV